MFLTSCCFCKAQKYLQNKTGMEGEEEPELGRAIIACSHKFWITLDCNLGLTEEEIKVELNMSSRCNSIFMPRKNIIIYCLSDIVYQI